MADFLPFMLNGRRGWIMTFAHGSFFDESEQFTEGEPLCVAGYTFKDSSYKQFCRAWQKLLATGIPGHPVAAMHMNSLIGHKRWFKEIELEPRVQFFEKAVSIICDHALIVTGALIDQKEFEDMAGPDWPDRWGSSYTTMCQRAAETTARW